MKLICFFFSSRRRHTRLQGDWSSDVCSSDLYPTIIAETAVRQKLFDKEGIKAELTIYRGGSEGYEAMAAGAADMIMNSASSGAAGEPQTAGGAKVSGGRERAAPRRAAGETAI